MTKSLPSVLMFRNPLPPRRRRLARCQTAALLLSLGTAALLACGSSREVVKQPEPVKVQWNKSDGEAADSRGSGDDTTPSGTEIDLDAPSGGASKESAKAAPEPPAPEPELVEEEAPSPAAAEPIAEAAEEPEEEEAPAAPPAAVPLGKEIREAVRGKEPKEKPAKKPAPKPKKAPPPEPAAPVATYTGTDACRAKSFSISRVAEACARNGRPGAKAVMKEAVSKALAGGASLKCADCHSDLRSYELKGDAVAQLKKWLGS